MHIFICIAFSECITTNLKMLSEWLLYVKALTTIEQRLRKILQTPKRFLSRIRPEAGIFFSPTSCFNPKNQKPVTNHNQIIIPMLPHKNVNFDYNSFAKEKLSTT